MRFFSTRRLCTTSAGLNGTAASWAVVPCVPRPPNHHYLSSSSISPAFRLDSPQIWLSRAHVPPATDFACARCAAPLVLLAQIYAPLDFEEGDVDHDGAFHRMLLVFSCARGACVDAAGSGGGAVRVWRCQLPRENADLPFDGAHELRAPLNADAPLCTVCGGPAGQRCSKCSTARYCSRAHQGVHWRGGHRESCSREGGGRDARGAMAEWDAAVHAGAVLPEWALSIENEPASVERAARVESSLPLVAREALQALRAGGGEGAGVDGEPSIDGLTQAELDDALRGGVASASRRRVDPTLTSFYTRIACAPEQVLRYCRWPAASGTDAAVAQVGGGERESLDQESKPAGAPALGSGKVRGIGARASGGAGAGGGDDAVANADGGDDDDDADDAANLLGAPLWFSQHHQPEPADIVPCERCGAPRAFEFQIMPQALNFVLPGGKSAVAAVDDSRVSLDFGTVAVYTCTRSCVGVGPASEFAWVQPSADENDKQDLIK